MTANSDPSPTAPDLGQTDYRAGQHAFERGEYRKAVELLEKATAALNPNTALGGEVQTWLVTAYEAAGDRTAAISLCKQLTRHPHLQTRKEGRRILYILEAPKLKSRPEWLTQIPDLAALDDRTNRDRFGATGTPSPRSTAPPKPKFPPEPVDLSQVNTEDNRFVWVALLAALVILGSLFWFS